MLCKNCGGSLRYVDGLYVCDNCGSKCAINDFYQDIDTYVCYVEVDEAGRRTKDSILAQDIYQKLEQAKIKTFYARISADMLTGVALEKVCNAAIYSAKTVLILGTKKQYFEKLIQKYSTLYAGKIIIPVYADMDAYEIPKGISAIQALDYNKIGAGVDLTRSIYNALGWEQELDYATLAQKSSFRKKTTLWVAVIVFAVAMLGLGVYFLIFGQPGMENPAETTQPSTEMTEATLSLEEIQENQYFEAMGAKDSGDYVKAIELLADLPEYKDSATQLNLIFQNYAGYYQSKEEAISFRLQVWEGNAAAIELTKTTSEGIRCMITESFQLQAAQQSFAFNDSENNEGNITLEFSNSEIIVSIESTTVTGDVSIENTKVAFRLDKKSDKPFGPQIDVKTLLGFLTQETNLDDLQRLGYEIEFVSPTYRIKYTDISFVISSFDKGTLQEPKIVEYITAICAPASIIAPEKIGAQNDSFVKGDIQYIPDSVLGVDGDSGLYWISKPVESRPISDDTMVCVVLDEGY